MIDEIESLQVTVEGMEEQIKIGRERIAALTTALGSAKGHLINARIDLETGTPKRITIGTIEGGIRLIDAALAEPSQHSGTENACEQNEGA